MKKMCLYIHIPYCKKRCMYCSFCSSQPPHTDIKEYVNAVKNEIALSQGKFDEVETVYFGGGTPSYIPAVFITEILQVIKDNFSLSESAEITLEANPDTITEKNAEIWQKGGVNRFSIGLQTANDGILKNIGRIHTAGDFVRGVNIFKNAGIKNISADIMLGLPFQTETDVVNTLDILTGLNIPHISAYGLKTEKGTLLYDMVERGQLTLPDDDVCADFYDIVYEMLKKRDIFRYEVSNFARKGRQCRHNLNYWERGEYVGFGVAAHSFYGGFRRENITDIKEYIRRQGRDCAASGIEITGGEAEFEYIMLALRTVKGINTVQFKKLFNEDFEAKYCGVLTRLKDFFVKKGQSIAVAEKSFNVLNGILTYFAP